MSFHLIHELIGFGLVGVINTMVDLALFNWLAGRRTWTNFRAHCCSSSTAMIISFLLNQNLVFPGTRMTERLPQFLVVTLLSLYVVQGSVIAGVGMIGRGSTHWVNQPRVRRNVGKGLALLAGLIWNFLWYKHYVFAVK
jgi:putative flippase GtrA